jgi:hypothetical protein
VRVPASEIAPGDRISWAGLVVEVEEIDVARFASTSKRAGRYLAVRLPDGVARRLHYYDVETVEREGAS